MLLPFLVPARAAELEPFIRERAAALAGELARQGGRDAATGFARQLAISVLTRLLDVSAEMAPRFIDWTARRNAHVTFGSGAHRCLGSPLARLEMRVVLEKWLVVIPSSR